MIYFLNNLELLNKELNQHLQFIIMFIIEFIFLLNSSILPFLLMVRLKLISFSLKL